MKCTLMRVVCSSLRLLHRESNPCRKLRFLQQIKHLHYLACKHHRRQRVLEFLRLPRCQWPHRCRSSTRFNKSRSTEQLLTNKVVTCTTLPPQPQCCSTVRWIPRDKVLPSLSLLSPAKTNPFDHVPRVSFQTTRLIGTTATFQTVIPSSQKIGIHHSAWIHRLNFLGVCLRVRVCTHWKSLNQFKASMLNLS